VIAICCLPWIMRFSLCRRSLWSLPILLSLDNLYSPASAVSSFLGLLGLAISGTAMSLIGFTLARPLKALFEKLRDSHQPAMRLP
jgi:hypothetical protein